VPTNESKFTPLHIYAHRIYILEKPPRPQGEKISADVIWRKKYEKGKNKGENVKQKERKGKEKKERGKKKRKLEVKGLNKCK
jgi:hypothetical protein